MPGSVFQPRVLCISTALASFCYLLCWLFPLRLCGFAWDALVVAFASVLASLRSLGCWRLPRLFASLRLCVRPAFDLALPWRSTERRTPFSASGSGQMLSWAVQGEGRSLEPSFLARIFWNSPKGPFPWFA